MLVQVNLAANLTTETLRIYLMCGGVRLAGNACLHLLVTSTLFRVVHVFTKEIDHMVPISYRRTIKNLLVVSAVGLSALFTFVAVFGVPAANADYHEHSQLAAIDASPVQAGHHEHTQLAVPIHPSPERAVQVQPAGPASASAIADITIVDFAFDPAIITITAGSSVRWTRSVSTIITHTTTSDLGSLDPWTSGFLAPGQTFTKVFNTPGTYTYHCEVHPFMHGTVVVLRAGPEPPAAVRIAGPFEGVINTGYTFTATVSPPTATVPITYFWQATGQSPITHVESDFSDSVTFTWTLGTTRTQLITATATNEGGTAIGTHILIFTPLRLHLPQVFR
jgi:plastocyanin